MQTIKVSMRVGLFRVPCITSPSSLGIQATKIRETVQPLIELITESPGKYPPSQTIRWIDCLSDKICRVVDLAECVRSVHPDETWRKDADKVWFILGRLVNELNTNSGLYRAVDAIVNDASVMKTLTDEEQMVARLFHADFVKSGVNMSSIKQQQFLALNDAINQAGTMFMKPTLPRSEKKDALRDMLQGRSKLASLLGFDSFSQMSLQDKMAKTPENVTEFLHKIRQQELPEALKVLDYLRPGNGFNFSLQEYYSLRKKLPSRYATPVLHDPIKVRKLLSAIETLSERVFGVQLITESTDEFEVWHSSMVKLTARNFHSREKLGTIYCDFSPCQPDINSFPSLFTIQCSRNTSKDFRNLPESFSRKWHDEYLQLENAGLHSKDRQYPVVTLVCPTEKIGSDLWVTSRSLETIFHEFGHALHAMMAQTELHHVSGTRCQVDFVEIPSLLMEKMARSGPVVKMYTNDASIPFSWIRSPERVEVDPVEKMHQIFFAALDLRLHSSNDVNIDDAVQVCLNKYHVVSRLHSGPELSFTHLFPYGSTYYSYLWSQTFADALFNHAFQLNKPWADGTRWKEKELNQWYDTVYKSGEHIRDEILRFGGSVDPWKMRWDRVLNGQPLPLTPPQS